MSTDRGTTQIVRSWLDEGVTRLPDRVLDAVLDQVPATRQRQLNWLTRRVPIKTNTSVRYGIAAAAIVFAVILGVDLLPRGTGSPPAPTPTPTASPSPSPSGTPRGFPGGESTLKGGRYTLNAGLGISMEVPEGWIGCCGGAISIGETPESAGILWWADTDYIVYLDPCHWKDSEARQPSGAESFAAALAAQPGRDATEPSEVTVANRTAWHVRLTVPHDLAVSVQPDGDSNFLDCDEQQYRTWSTLTADAARYQQGRDQVDDVYLIGAGGRTIVFDMTYFPETSISDRVTLETVLGSIQID